MPDDYRVIVDKSAAGDIQATISGRPQLSELGDEQVLIEVHWSSLNYKDALAASGNPGVVRKLPLTPGIDAAGVIAASNSPRFQVGQAVLATGYEFGVNHDGGWATKLTAPADWVAPLPDGLSLQEAMVYGTAGFTAGQCVDALIRHGVEADGGPVVVTGATGGVGSLAVAVLSGLGYEVVAVTGKADRESWLKQLGAASCLSREEVGAEPSKPLLKSRWSGAVDTVGGATLANLLASTRHRGCVTACGLVGGTDLRTTVHPFILRGVTLAGIDSAMCPMEPRLDIWRKLAGAWKPVKLAELATEVSLHNVLDQVPQILAGKMVGRVIVNVRDL